MDPQWEFMSPKMWQSHDSAQLNGLYWTGFMLTCHALHTCTSTINVNILKWSNFQLSIEQVSVEWLSLFTFRRCHEMTECQIG